MGNKLYLHIITVGLLLLTSCQKSFKPEEYKAWIENEENGLRKQKAIQNFQYDLQYLSPEYKVILSNGPTDFDKLDLETELSHYEEDYSFQFVIKNLDGLAPLRYNLYDENEYYGRLQYFNNEVSEDFYLLTDKQDTLSCQFAHLERDFGISPEIRLQLGFGEIIEEENVQFCFNDRVFQNGKIKFKIDWDDLSEKPVLTKG